MSAQKLKPFQEELGAYSGNGETASLTVSLITLCKNQDKLVAQ